MKVVLKVLVAGLLLGLIALGAATYYVVKEANAFLTLPPNRDGQEVIVSIPSGSTPRRIADLLAAEGIVTNAQYFTYLVRYDKVGPKLKAGEFSFNTGMLPRQVIKVLVDGKEVLYKITIPEGYRFLEMAPLVDAVPFLSGERFLTLVQDEAFATELGVGAPNLEGFLFPETYLLARRETEADLVRRMVGRFNAIWTPAFDAQAKTLGLTRLEVVSLASVIEKETGVASERPLIGSVFHNRLKKGMKLQSDPTIIYGLPNYDGNIRRKDIRHPHRWNTYVIEGIPPTPIASPGEAALKAALWPETSDYLFFVARGNGTHFFSATYAEHSRAVIKYQLGGRAPKEAMTAPE